MTGLRDSPSPQASLLGVARCSFWLQTLARPFTFLLLVMADFDSRMSQSLQCHKVCNVTEFGPMLRSLVTECYQLLYWAQIEFREKQIMTLLIQANMIMKYILR